MKLTKEEIKFKNRTTWAFVGFTFQTFFKRPFGYIIALLYVLYLSIILLIVPAGVHLEPLFIWSNAAINMPIFNLFFIAAASGSLAVAVFRTGIDDGTELSLSAKPITKNTRVFGKTFTYLMIMLGFTAITLAILSLIYPVFGEYNVLTNPTGIAYDKYVGLLLSILVGNIVNMLFFGGIAVLISMVGGQVIILVATVGIAFLMVLLNVIFPIAIQSPLSVLNDRYNSSINSMATSTRADFNKSDDSKHKNFAAIQCITEQSGEEVNHLDTNEYWTRVNNESGLRSTSYIDFGKQLSYIFSAFGVDEAKLIAASKLMIGANTTDYYKIDGKTHITDEENLTTQKYPLSIYSIKQKQGITFPTVLLMSGSLDVNTDNWFATTTLYKANWDSVVIASDKPSSVGQNSELKSAVSKTWYKMSDLLLTNAELKQSKIMFNSMLTENKIQDYSADYTHANSAISHIIDYNNEVFWQGDFNALDVQKRFEIVSKIGLSWKVFAQDKQIEWIDQYCLDNHINDSFPYTSKTVKSWYQDMVYDDYGTKKQLYAPQYQLSNMYQLGINAGRINDTSDRYLYTAFQKTTLEYAETYKNLYQYNVSPFYNVNLLILIWTLISAGLFTTSIIVYKKTDFK